jgi:hypothetical protein
MYKIIHRLEFKSRLGFYFKIGNNFRVTESRLEMHANGKLRNSHDARSHLLLQHKPFLYISLPILKTTHSATKSRKTGLKLLERERNSFILEIVRVSQETNSIYLLFMIFVISTQNRLYWVILTFCFRNSKQKYHPIRSFISLYFWEEREEDEMALLLQQRNGDGITLLMHQIIWEGNLSPRKLHCKL